jgi:hypothetical protein
MARVVRLRKIVAASKNNVAVGKWRTVKVSRADFPMAKAALGFAQPFLYRTRGSPRPR